MLLGSVGFESTGAELLAFMVAQPAIMVAEPAIMVAEPELVETAIEPETVPEEYTQGPIGLPV